MAELTIHALQWCAQHVHPVLALRVRHSERIFVVALSAEDATALTPRPNHGTGQGNLRLLALVESAITCLGARAVAVSLRVGDDSVLSASLRLDGPTGVREVQTHFADGVAFPPGATPPPDGRPRSGTGTARSHRWYRRRRDAPSGIPGPDRVARPRRDRGRRRCGDRAVITTRRGSMPYPSGVAMAVRSVGSRARGEQEPSRRTNEQDRGGRSEKVAGLRRREVLRGLALGGAGFGGLRPSSPFVGRARDATPTGSGERFAAEVDAGLDYFRRRAAEQVPLVAARPPYEEIEVLAASFPETDEAIDARPYAIAGGESSPDYRSVHRIESLLFRDSDLVAALPYADGLIGSANALLVDLDRREGFDAVRTFEGRLALSEEVASKKVSSEEETWSDQNLLIIFHNWRGIESQYAPFAPAVELTDASTASAVGDALASAIATLKPYPTGNGVFPAYSAVPASARGEIVRASYGLRDALTRAGSALDLV